MFAPNGLFYHFERYSLNWSTKTTRVQHLVFVLLTKQQLPQQVFVVRLATERTPPEEALMIQSVVVIVPLHHHISWFLGARKQTHPSGNLDLQTRLQDSVWPSYDSSCWCGSRVGAERALWFAAREVGSAASPALGKHSTAPVDVLADRQEKQKPKISPIGRQIVPRWLKAGGCRRAGTPSEVLLSFWGRGGFDWRHAKCCCWVCFLETDKTKSKSRRRDIAAHPSAVSDQSEPLLDVTTSSYKL